MWATKVDCGGSNDGSKGSSNNADAIIYQEIMVTAFGKNIWQFLKRLNKVTLLSCDPVAALLSIPPREKENNVCIKHKYSIASPIPKMPKGRNN